MVGWMDIGGFSKKYPKAGGNAPDQRLRKINTIWDENVPTKFSLLILYQFLNKFQNEKKWYLYLV